MVIPARKGCGLDRVIVVDHRPASVAIDPYYKLIDRDRGDNVRAVLPAGTQAGP